MNVPNIAVAEEKIDRRGPIWLLYVKAKEGFYRLEKKLGLTKAQLEALNPELVQQGLKLGMVLKDPKDKCSKYCYRISSCY